MAISPKAEQVRRFGRLLKSAVSLETLEELPEVESHRGPEPRARSVGAMLFELEPLPEAPPEPDPVPAAKRGFWARVFSIEELPEDPEPPPATGPRRAGLFTSLFGLETLGVEPQEKPRPSRLPLFEWLLWPESLDEKPPSSREK